MNCDLMKQYIEFVADRLLLELGFDKVGLFYFNIANYYLFIYFFFWLVQTNMLSWIVVV